MHVEVSLRRSSFLRASLLLPLATPSLAPPLSRNGIELGGLLPILSMALVIGGGPYLVFLAASLWVLRRKKTSEILDFFYLAPVWYLVPLNLGLAIFALVAEGDIPLGAWAAFAFYSGFGLAVGYFYVVVALGVYFLLDRMGWFGARRITIR